MKLEFHRSAKPRKLSPLSSPPHLLRGLGWIFLSILCWAPMFSIGKRALSVVDAFGLATLRYAFGSMLLVALLWAIEGRQALRL